MPGFPLGGGVLRQPGVGAFDAGGMPGGGVQLACGGTACEADLGHRLQDAGEGEPDGGGGFRGRGNLDGAHGLGRVVDSGAAAGEPGGEHAAVVGLCQVASGPGVLVEVFPGAVLVRVEADVLGIARRVVPEHLPDRHRKGVLGEGPGILHEGAAVLGIPVGVFDGNITTGDVSRAVQDTGRRRASGGSVPAFPSGVGVSDIPVACGSVGGGRALGFIVVKGAMALRGHVAENTLFRDDVVPDTLDKPEPVAGEGQVGPVFEAGGGEEGDRSGDLVRHAAFRAGGDVCRADRFLRSLSDDQHPLYGQTDTGGVCEADAGFDACAGVVLGDVADGDGRADASRDGGVEIDSRCGDGDRVLRGRVPAVPVFGAERDDGHIKGTVTAG